MIILFWVAEARVSDGSGILLRGHEQRIQHYREQSANLFEDIERSSARRRFGALPATRRHTQIIFVIVRKTCIFRLFNTYEEILFIGVGAHLAIGLFLVVFEGVRVGQRTFGRLGRSRSCPGGVVYFVNH
jgi:hypothetical protein